MLSITNRMLLILIFAVWLSGCMVGPTFRRPAPPFLDRYNEKPLPRRTARTPEAGKGGISQVYVVGKDIRADWWSLFHSRALNELVVAGIKNSPNLAAAKASLVQAQQTLVAQIGTSLYPAFGLQGSGQRGQANTAQAVTAGLPPGFGGGGGGSIFNLFNTAINVTYVLDVFGGQRRQIEAVRAQMDNVQFQLLAAYLTLTSNIVTTAITVASLEAQIKATRELITIGDNQLKILNGQFRLGAIAKADVLTQQVFVEQTKATLPPLQKQLSVNKHALTTLLGVYPNSRLPRLRLEKLTLPKTVPISIPLNLVRQRPDVLQAEALMHVASAQIGVATANLLPQFNITGTYGWTAAVPNQLFSPATNFWNIASSITQPLFQGGALLATRRAAIAGFEATQAQYRNAVLQALQNVADSLRAIDTDARTLKAQKIAEDAANQALNIAQQQFKLGGVPYVTLLIAQQQYQQAKLRRIRAETDRYLSTATLYQSLGGGWWNTDCRICRRLQFVMRQLPGNCGSCLVAKEPL